MAQELANTGTELPALMTVTTSKKGKHLKYSRHSKVAVLLVLIPVAGVILLACVPAAPLDPKESAGIAAPPIGNLPPVEPTVPVEPTAPLMPSDTGLPPTPTVAQPSLVQQGDVTGGAEQAQENDASIDPTPVPTPTSAPTPEAVAVPLEATTALAEEVSEPVKASPQAQSDDEDGEPDPTPIPENTGQPDQEKYPYLRSGLREIALAAEEEAANNSARSTEAEETIQVTVWVDTELEDALDKVTAWFTQQEIPYASNEYLVEGYVPLTLLGPLSNVEGVQVVRPAKLMIVGN